MAVGWWSTPREFSCLRRRWGSVTDDRDLQAHVLRSAGLDVIEPSDNPFKEAITRRPDAVVVDVSPKGQGSREFVQTLKQDRRTAAIPVVVISGYPRTDLPPTPDQHRCVLAVLSYPKAAPGGAS